MLRFPPLDETFAKLSGFPRSRGKCPKDKGGRCRMIKPKKTPRKRVLQRSLDDRGRCCVFLPLDETFAKLSGLPRSRGKCPKDKGGRCRMIKPKTPRKRVLQRSRNRQSNRSLRSRNRHRSRPRRPNIPTNQHHHRSNNRRSHPDRDRPNPHTNRRPPNHRRRHHRPHPNPHLLPTPLKRPPQRHPRRHPTNHRTSDLPSPSRRRVGL